MKEWRPSRPCSTDSSRKLARPLSRRRRYAPSGVSRSVAIWAPVTAIDCPLMAIPGLLDELLRAHGPSGHEQLAHDVVRAAVDGIADVESDTAGNLFVRRSGGGAAPLLGLFAHVDVIGLAV